MPSGPLPPEDYLGDPNRITSEFQEQLNNLQNYVRQLKAELDALSSQTIREGAVRGIGTGSNDIRDNALLEDRLGSMAEESAADYLRKSEFDPASPEVVYSGGVGSLAFLNIDNSDLAGIYSVDTGHGPVLLHIPTSFTQSCYGVGRVFSDSTKSQWIRIVTVAFSRSDKSLEAEVLTISAGGTIGYMSTEIQTVFKL